MTKTEAGARLLSGTEVLVEAIKAVRRFDAEAGLNTAGFVSGYRGSPLGGLDQALWNAQEELSELNVRFVPGLNEELAATACWGTQQSQLMPKGRHDGVFAFWYGKGPGVDRAVDAIKHGNYAGTAPAGGVVMLVGDDHGCKSSSIPHQSEQSLIAAGIPVLNPSSVQEYIEYLPLAVEMSRFSGLWIAVKCVTETVESAATITLPISKRTIERPPVKAVRPISLEFAPMENERSLFDDRLPAARAFAVASGIDGVLYHATNPVLGIVATGKGLIDVREALRLLGLDGVRGGEAGVGLFKVGMTWPVAGETIVPFARAYRELLVVEEKRKLIETELASVLLAADLPAVPRLLGKHDPDGRQLLPEHGELNPALVADAIAGRMVALDIATPEVRDWLARRGGSMPAAASAPFLRKPMYCSGCPHNRSTRLPDDSTAFSGIGCHGMAMWMPERRTLPSTQMGGEGANWIGIEPFSDLNHIFQNMGDGTFAHSGSLAIRAAIAAKSNVTFKILYNSAVAMTGGQPVEAQPSPLSIATQLTAEGAAHVVVVTDDPSRYPSPPAGVAVLPRDDLDDVQKRLRAMPGVTVLIYDQYCAAERRRLRKMGKAPDPAVRAYINPDVCVDCGDCTSKSSCVSIRPFATELGIKRRIDQDSCNKDFTCTEGFCPSFLTIRGGALRKSAAAGTISLDALSSLPEPETAKADGVYNMLIGGIGGTGVISLGALLARAARREGIDVLTFNVTGVAQKNGPVYSHVRLLGAADASTFRPRIPDGQVDLLLACDIVGAASPDLVKALDRNRTAAVISDMMIPTGDFYGNPQLDISSGAFRTILEARLPQPHYAPAEAAWPSLRSDALLNLFVLGNAVQRGLVPIANRTIEAEIDKDRSGANLFAYRLGRLSAHDPDAFAQEVRAADQPIPLAEQNLLAIVTKVREVLTLFHGARYAAAYEAFVRRVEVVDRIGEFTRQVALGLFAVMYYKDEYEVARLHRSPEALDRIRKEFSGDFKIEYHLAPPILARLRTRDGEPRKVRLGSWFGPILTLLSHLKFLRNTPFDIFGYTQDKRLDRALIEEYRGWIDDILPCLAEADYAVAVAIAALPTDIRGYGHIRARRADAARDRYRELRSRLVAAAPDGSAAPASEGDQRSPNRANEQVAD